MSPDGGVLRDSGGGGGGKQESTTYTSNLPEYAQPYFERGMERAEALSQEGYIPYTGQRIEGYSPQQQQLFQQTYGLQRPGELTGASQATEAATLGALGTQYGPGQFTYGAVTPDQLSQYQMTQPTDVAAERATSSVFGTPEMQQYISPFQQGVTDVAKRQAALDAMKIQQATNLGAARQGTYGGARQLLGQTEREKALGQQLSDIQTKGSQAAFENAQTQFERDQARRMAAQQLNVQEGLRAQLANQQAGLTTGQQNLAARLGVQQLGAQQSLEAQRANQAALMEAQKAGEQSRQFGANLGLQGLQTALTGAGQLSQIGKDIQATDLSRLQAQQAVAGSEQSQRQKSLDMAYQDFLAQREFPYRQLEFYNAMLRGLPVKADTTSSTYQAQPNIAQQVLGYGIPALALSKAFSAT
jgi:hypothetical protein